MNYKNDDTKTGIGGIRDPELFLLSNLISHSMEDERNLSCESVLWSTESALKKIACPHYNGSHKIL